MAIGNIREIYHVNNCQLEKIIVTESVIRVGATKRPIQERAQEYERDGFSGIMFYADTTNMKYAENRLLELAKRHENTARHNEHHYSNVGEENGYVYVIQGKKFTF